MHPSSGRPRSRLASLFFILFVASPTHAKQPPTILNNFTPDPASVQRCGPAYRYPQAGWIVIHVEGEPYERGYQYGKLIAPELADYIKALAVSHSPKAPSDGWRSLRLLCNTLFLRRYDKEYLEEMKGIADGASAAGARFDKRVIDLIDIATVNSSIEYDFLESAMENTPTGLEGMKFDEPPYAKPRKLAKPHCSAFAATGPATADGKVVFGHITMFGLYTVRHFNVWLDIKPAKGHRVAMQTFPGGIMSGMDYYMNDAGLLVAETTIRQTHFDINGWSLVARIRKALQYADNIDDAVKLLKDGNNGLYSNEWLLADTKTNEIAMFELGTKASKLWRSSKNEWFGGTEGFYWGCNNTKDLQVRLETIPSVHDRPANMVFAPAPRDIAWLKLYDKHKGKIDARFGFEAFTTPPIAAFPSCDAKFTTSDMAKQMQTYTIFGPPLGRTWEATDEERQKYPDIRPLIANDWTVLNSMAKPASEESSIALDLVPKALTLTANNLPDEEDDEEPLGKLPPAWRGTLLPKTNGDVGYVAAFAELERIAALEKALKARSKDGKLTAGDQEQLRLALFSFWTRKETAYQRLGRQKFASGEFNGFKPDYENIRNGDWLDLYVCEMVLDLYKQRAMIGGETFDKLADDFGRTNAGTKVSQEFATVILKPLMDALDKRDESANGRGKSPHEDNAAFDFGGIWSTTSFEKEPDAALIIYGTQKEADAQREAAELLQNKLRRRTGNFTVPIKSDKEVTDEELKTRHLLLIGRPDTNPVAAKSVKNLPLTFNSGSFVLRNQTYANPASAVIAAGQSPFSDRYSIVLYAGLSAESTWHSVQKLSNRGGTVCEVLLLAAGSKPKPMVVPPKENPVLKK